MTRRERRPQAPPLLRLPAAIAAPALLLFGLTACVDSGAVVFKREAASAPLGGQELDAYNVDFRYSPASWQSTIGLPDDGLKTLVSGDGTLLYDYQGGEAPGFDTRIAVAVRGFAPARTAQSMPDARVPVVETALLDGGGKARCSWKAMAVVPGDDQELPGIRPQDIAAGARGPSRHPQAGPRGGDRGPDRRARRLRRQAPRPRPLPRRPPLPERELALGTL